MIQGNWVPRTVGLRFLFGEVVLCRITFSLLVHDAHFTEMEPEPMEPQVCWNDVPPSVDGFLVESRPVGTPLARLTRLPNALRYVPQQYVHCYVNLRQSFDDYMKQLGSKGRTNLKSRIRRFTEHCGGEMRWRRFTTVADLNEFYPLAREVSKRTYQERLLQAGLPAGEEFQRDMLERAACGQARGYLLFHGDKPVSYLYAKARGDILLSDYFGYDPAYRALALGTVLHFLALQSLYEEGVFRMYDFGTGEGDHKRFFSTDRVPCADIYYLRKTLKNEALLRSHAATDRLSSAAGKALAALHLKAAVKRILRRN